MTPYADFTYFGVALYPVVPAAVQGLLGRLSRRFIIGAATFGMLLVQYWSPIRVGSGRAGLLVQEVWLVAAYALLQWAVARSLLQSRRTVSHRWPFWLAMAVALAPLAGAKFLPVLAPGTQLGFLGISYVTFRSLDVLFGIQDRVITRLPTTQYLAYLFFFPTVSSGPIDRFRRFERDWMVTRSRAQFLQDLDQAVHRIIRGFLYKFVLGALVKVHWLDLAAGGSGFLSACSYMYAYSLYLFFDFAGYSAFAVGFSYLFGIHTPENFDRPFLSSNIREFWNRWHISLSWWFRDHVYMRFVLAAAKGRWFRDTHVASHLGFLLAMGLMGLWHGTAWYYIGYGLYHGVLLAGHDVFARWNKRRRFWGDGPVWRAAAIVLTFHAVAFGFLLFSGRLGSAGTPAPRRLG